MAFNSNIGGMPVIDDDNWQTFVDEADADPEKGRGHMPRKWDEFPPGKAPFSAPFTLPLIPRGEWEDRLKEMTETKSLLSDICAHSGVKIKNQQSTNYCWIFAPTTCLEICHVQQGNPYVELSPASAGAIIKGYRNVGGWGTEANKFLAERGAVPAKYWPSTYWQNNKYATTETEEMRKRHRVLEWWDLKPRNLDEIMTCLFLRIPVAVGFNWWAHEVTAENPVLRDGQWGYTIRNSWNTTWGEQGRGVVLGDKARADDAVAPRQAVSYSEAV